MAKIEDPMFQRVLECVTKAGPEGIELKDIETQTGIPYRKVHNATWRLEGSPKDGSLAHPEDRKIHRVNTTGKVRYAKTTPGTPRVTFLRAAPGEGKHTYATTGPKAK